MREMPSPRGTFRQENQAQHTKTLAEVLAGKLCVTCQAHEEVLAGKSRPNCQHHGGSFGGKIMRDIPSPWECYARTVNTMVEVLAGKLRVTCQTHGESFGGKTVRDMQSS